MLNGKHHNRDFRIDWFRSVRRAMPRNFIGICLAVGMGFACSLFLLHQQVLPTRLSKTTNKTDLELAILSSDSFEPSNNSSKTGAGNKARLKIILPISALGNNSNDTLSDLNPTNRSPHTTLLGVGNNSSPKQNPPEIKTDSKYAITIAYAVSLISCGTRWDASFDHITEGGAILKHSIHRASVRGTLGGKYDYKMYAIYNPNASACAPLFADMGYELVEREFPIRVEDIRGEELRETIRDDGCCGEKEFIKLEAYTLTSHPIVVHLDLDAVILKPMDAIFDLMLTELPANRTYYPGNSTLFSNIHFMWPDRPIPSRTNFVFTRDYYMIAARSTKEEKKYPPIQGGFLVLRPDMNVYRRFIEVILEGNFHGSGWGGVISRFYGYTTIQGLLPYFYDVLHPGQSVEVNWCVYNQMAPNPLFDSDDVNGTCLTGEKECEDCRLRPLEDIVTAHFTICRKPWICWNYEADNIDARLCKKMLHEWYRLRSELEISRGRSGWGDGLWNRDHFFGFCFNDTDEGFQKINWTASS